MKTSRPRAPRAVSPAKWAKMTPAQKAVAIAKDAVYRVERGQLRAQEGGFVDFTEHIGMTTELQYVLKQAAPDTCICNVCALGGAIVGLAAMEDNMRTGDAAYSFQRYRLFPIFGEDNLRRIELAFEGGGGYYSPEVENEEDMAAVRFGEQYSDAKERFLAIWRNVIKNKGQFVPSRT